MLAERMNGWMEEETEAPRITSSISAWEQEGNGASSGGRVEVTMMG